MGHGLPRGGGGGAELLAAAEALPTPPSPRRQGFPRAQFSEGSTQNARFWQLKIQQTRGEVWGVCGGVCVCFYQEGITCGAGGRDEVANPLGTSAGTPPWRASRRSAPVMGSGLCAGKVMPDQVIEA